LIFGALGSTGLMLPVTLQYSGVARTARPSATVCGAAGTSAAAAIVTPVVGKPIVAAGIVRAASESHATFG
jgi:hypothetical protein